jgi:hypothetical protein
MAMRSTIMATVAALVVGAAAAALAGQQVGQAAGTDAPAAVGVGEAQEFGGRSYADLDAAERDAVGFADTASGWRNGEDAEALLGTTVVDRGGQTLGEVVDLVVAEDDTIDRAVLEVRDGGEERFVVIPLDDLQRAEGDDTDQVTLDRVTAADDHFTGESAYEKTDGRWQPAPLR